MLTNAQAHPASTVIALMASTDSHAHVQMASKESYVTVRINLNILILSLRPIKSESCFIDVLIFKIVAKSDIGIVY